MSAAGGAGDGAHTVVTSQQIDGWRSVCACGWSYEGTSPSMALRAAELHVAAPAATLPGREEGEG